MLATATVSDARVRSYWRRNESRPPVFWKPYRWFFWPMSNLQCLVREGEVCVTVPLIGFNSCQWKPKVGCFRKQCEISRSAPQILYIVKNLGELVGQPSIVWNGGTTGNLVIPDNEIYDTIGIRPVGSQSSPQVHLPDENGVFDKSKDPERIAVYLSGPATLELKDLAGGTATFDLEPGLSLCKIPLGVWHNLSFEDETAAVIFEQRCTPYDPSLGLTVRDEESWRAQVLQPAISA